MARTRKKIDFEEKLKGLEDIVQQLEDGELSLEESLSAFEQGVKLTRECQTALDTARQKVQMLTEKDGAAETVEFDPENSDR